MSPLGADLVHDNPFKSLRVSGESNETVCVFKTCSILWLRATLGSLLRGTGSWCMSRRRLALVCFLGSAAFGSCVCMFSERQGRELGSKEALGLRPGC